MPTAIDHARVVAGNYMAYRGNRLRFGKLTMTDTDMILIDMDRKDPFDFYLDHYVEQLVAGYTKETPSFGLRVFMRDFHKLKKVESPTKASKRTTKDGHAAPRSRKRAVVNCPIKHCCW